MTFAESARRRGPLALLIALIAVVMVTTLATPAPAAPAGTDPEGGSRDLLAALEKASRGYSEARGRLVASKKRQAELVAQQRDLQKRADALNVEVDEIAAAAYRGGNADVFTSTVASGSVAVFLDKAGMLEQLSQRNTDKLSGLREARAEVDRQKKRIDAEIAAQGAQEAAMAKRKADAERALGASTGVAAGFNGRVPRADRAAPRRADGTFAPQSCAIDDPTSGGCLTPRTLSALEQAKADGFTRFVACFRQASFGEHPKGRACDFAAAPSGFQGVASGEDKAYGDRLSAYFIANASRLGVLYVIWFKRIWLPGVGWRAYSGARGTPSTDHTNHVHLSVM